MNGTGRTTALWATVGAALLVLLVVPALAAPASASLTPAAGSDTQQWAYGAQKWVNVSENFGNATYTAHAFFGWQVVVTATNTSSTTVALEAQRTLLGSYYAQLCAPACAGTNSSHGNLSVVGWEKDAGFANLTTSASVFVNGSAVAAIGLTNASAQASGNITELLSLTLATPAFSGSSSSALYVSGAAHSSVGFTPSLGLVPQSVSAGMMWNSSAPFSAAGGWSINALWTKTTFAGATTSGTFAPTGSVSGSGTLDLQGADLGTVTLKNGATVPVIALQWSGPFDDEDGVILIPHDFDLFGDGSHEWASASLTNQAAATSNVDVAVDASHHLRVVAAATSFNEADTSLSTEAVPARGPAPASASTGATTLQAQPEPVTTAQSTSSCYVSHCPAAGSASGMGGLGLALVVGLIATVVIGSVSVIEYRVWARKRAQSGMPGPSSPVRAASPPPGAYLGNAPPTPPSAPQEPPRSP